MAIELRERRGGSAEAIVIELSVDASEVFVYPGSLAWHRAQSTRYARPEGPDRALESFVPDDVSIGLATSKGLVALFPGQHDLDVLAAKPANWCRAEPGDSQTGYAICHM